MRSPRDRRVQGGKAARAAAIDVLAASDVGDEPDAATANDDTATTNDDTDATTVADDAADAATVVDGENDDDSVADVGK